MKKLLSVLLITALLVASGTMAFASGSADESLDKLAVSKSESTSSSKLYDMFPKFDPEIADYYVFLSDGTDSAYIYMKPDNSKYKVYCDGDLVDEDDDYFAYVKKISDGDEIEIEVKDRDDKKLDTYTVTFICGDDDDDDEARLDDLYVKSKDGRDSYSKVSLNKDFSRDESSYTVSVKENDYDTVRIYAEPKDSHAHIIMNGEYLDDDEYLDFKVKRGKNEFTINVIAENCDDTEKYTLTVNYDSTTTEEKAEVNLSTISVKDSSGNNVALSPSFLSSRKNYTASVANFVNSASFYVTSGSNTTMYVNNAVLNPSTWSQSYALKEGTNTFNITAYLTGDSYDIKNYSVSIFRYPAKTDAMVSIQNMNVNGIGKQLNAYNISGSNFVKLRDIASLLSGTTKQFSIGYNELTNSIGLLSAGYYTPNGQENTALKAPKEIMISVQPITLDNQAVYLTSYNIDGSNFVMLRDLALLLNFGLTYNSATDTIQITTTQSYSVS